MRIWKAIKYVLKFNVTKGKWYILKKGYVKIGQKLFKRL